MEETVCELCGRISELSVLEIHYIVPVDTTEEAGASGSATAILCRKCHQDVHGWYTKNVSTMAYNPITQRFAPKSSADMAKEYKAAYGVFAQYKKGQRKKV